MTAINDNSHDVMYSFLFSNNNRQSLAGNVHKLQRNDTVTKRHYFKPHEDNIQRIQDMNFTLASTFRVTGATTTSSDSFSASKEHYMDVRFSQDIGNITLAVSKVRYISRMNIISSLIYISDYPGNHDEGASK